MAGFNGNGIGQGLLGGGLNRGEGAQALYGDAPITAARPLANVSSNVDLSSPKAMRAEATRLQKAGHPTQALRLINQANQQSSAMYTNQQQALKTTADAAAAAKAESDKGRIPDMAEQLRASPTTAALAPLLIKGDISIEDAGRALAADVTTTRTNDRANAKEGRAVDAAVLSKRAADNANEAHSWAKITNTNNNKKLAEAGTDKMALLKVQDDMATEMAQSEYGNPAVIKLLGSGTVLSADFVNNAYKTFQEKDPTSAAALQASNDSYSALQSTIQGLVATEQVDQEAYDSILAMGERLKGESSQSIDAYARIIGPNARRLGRTPRPPNGLEIDYAYELQPAIAEALPESFIGFGQDRQGELGAFTLALASLTPSMSEGLGIDSVSAASEILRMIETNLAADPSWSALDLSDAVTTRLLQAREASKVNTGKSSAAQRAAARAAATQR